MSDTTQIAAVIGAISGVVAAMTGVFNALSQYFSNRERILVGFGSVRADGIEGDSLYVLNQSGFNVELRDYGFVIKGGDLFSIPLYAELEGFSPDDGFFRKGEPIIEPRCLFRVGMECSKTVVGAYALTVSQTLPVVKIRSGYTFVERTNFWCKAKFFRSYC